MKCLFCFAEMEYLEEGDQLIIYIKGDVQGQYAGKQGKVFHFCRNPICPGFVLADMKFFTEDGGLDGKSSNLP